MPLWTGLSVHAVEHNPMHTLWHAAYCVTNIEAPLSKVVGGACDCWRVTTAGVDASVALQDLQQARSQTMQRRQGSNTSARPHAQPQQRHQLRCSCQSCVLSWQHQTLSWTMYGATWPLCCSSPGLARLAQQQQLLQQRDKGSSCHRLRLTS
jgi:hypothetical protein